MSLLGGVVRSALIVAIAAACSAARPPAQRSAARAPIRQILPNGIAVIVQEHRISDVVAIQLWVRAGGRDEGVSELGLAHYLEHMLFKGTVSRPGGVIQRSIEATGGKINAGTLLDYTYYHVVLPARFASMGMEALADIAVNARLDESALELEKRVVLEEIRRSEDLPDRSLSRRIFAEVFAGHPYGRSVLGMPDLIRNLNHDTLSNFYHRHYVPEAFTLVVVGSVVPADILGLATPTFGRLPRSGYRRLPAPTPAATQFRKVEIDRPESLAYLGMAWVAPKLDHADTPAVDLLVSILGQTRSSRLPRSLREHLGLVNSVGADYTALEAAGLVTVTAQLETANLGATENQILKEVQRVRDEGVGEAELRRAITLAEAHHEFAMETAEGRAHALGRAETVWRLEEELAYVDRLRAVTIEQVRAAARRYLHPDRYARIALVPSDRRPANRR